LIVFALAGDSTITNCFPEGCVFFAKIPILALEPFLQVPLNDTVDTIDHRVLLL